ncbi:MAG: OmpA family protein [Steroidobacteraceae bacterium]|nr:OmpA family protein [Steroidobacteraceae bacterium]
MTSTIDKMTIGRTLIAATVASVLLAACATSPSAPEGSADVRARLAQLQSDPNLATRATVAIKEADVAVSAAEQPEADAVLGSHRVYIADRKVEIARAQAETRLFEDQRATLSAQRETARLDSRTREADAARDAAAVARSDADDAQAATAEAQEQTAELQRQIDAMNAKVTDRGLVLTLGDVLFASGRADLKSGTISRLDHLVAFLGKYPTRTVTIEGHTDSVGGDDYNQGLSQRRADSVRSYIVRQGVDAGRVTTMGAGESTPVAGNDTESGRQQNRRVEVIISNPALAAR